MENDGVRLRQERIQHKFIGRGLEKLKLELAPPIKCRWAKDEATDRMGSLLLEKIE
jgi:hypothetical protein